MFSKPFAIGIAVALGIVPFCAASAQTPASPDAPFPVLAPLSAGRTTVGWDSTSGLTLSVEGVPVVRKSTLYLVKTGWSGVLLDQGKERPVITSWHDSPGGGKAASIVLENANARCEYNFTVNAPGSAVTVDLAYRLKAPISAAIEYAAGYLSGPVLQGTTATAPSGAQTLIPVAAASPELPQEQRRLLSPFTDLRFDTRLGNLGITFSGDSPKPVLFDGRRDSEGWAKDYPVFWMGIGSPEQPVSLADGTRHAIFRYSISAPVVSPLLSALPGFTGPITSYKDACTPVYAPVPLVLPRPKEMEVAPPFRLFRLGKRTRLVVRDGATESDKRGAVLLQSEMKARFGLTLPVLSAQAAHGLDDAIVFGEPDRATGSMTRALTGLPPLKPEGYTVAVSPETVLVAGHDPAGTLWGAQTLIQLLAADATGPLIRPVIIHDWPTLSVRGVHLFHGKNALPFQQKLIDRVLARFKMNALFIQAEQAKWDADPQVAPEWGGTKADLITEVAYGKARGITVYPLIQGYGHMEWLFNRDRNREFAEDPQTPYAMNFSNPAAVSYLTRFVDEADTAFDAPGFHVGLDEIDMRGRFPLRSQPRTAPDLIVSAARYWHDHLKARGKEMWMWADMALNHDDVAPSWGSNKSAADAAAIRAGIPKDVVMVDWQYSPRDTYPSLKRLKDAGFTKIVAATWFDLAGNQNFSKAAADSGALGAMITTWAGYESNEKVLDGPERRQFVAMVAAADYFWNGGQGPAPDALPYSPDEVFAHQWASDDPAISTVRPGFTVDLGGAANAPLADWNGYGLQNSPGLPQGKATRLADGTRYHIGSQVVVLAGKLNPAVTAAKAFPLAAVFPLAKPARTVRLLLATSNAAPLGTKVGTVLVKRTDGITETVELIYGTNIAALTDTRPLNGAQTVWRGVTGAGEAVWLRRVEWDGGKAGAIAESVSILSTNTQAAPAVFAVSGLTR